MTRNVLIADKEYVSSQVLSDVGRAARDHALALLMRGLSHFG